MIVDIVFQEKLDRDLAPVKEFVEVEDLDGRSLQVGEWVTRDDGLVALRLEIAE